MIVSRITQSCPSAQSEEQSQRYSEFPKILLTCANTCSILLLMNETAEQQIEVFKRLCVPRVSSADWGPGTAKVALRELRRLRGELASAEAVLVGVMKTETGRDTKATLTRGFGMSCAEAAKAEQVADVVARIPGADDALAEGSVTGEHLRKLAPITDSTEAAELFELAPSQSPDEFAKTVDRHRIAKDSEGWRARQRAARSVRFFKADDGCTGIRAILPTLDGERVKAAINEACDNAWRAAHPERAEVAGGHDDEPRERRLADAFVSLVLGEPSASNGGSARTALIVTVQAETLEAQILGSGPVPTADAVDLIDDARTDLYAAIRAADGAILKFGRSRRLASALQKLALALREHGRCAFPGCMVPWNRCDADHDPPWETGGLTNLDTMKLMCTNGHHTHRHETGNNITRQPDGTWTVDNEPLETWPPPPVCPDGGHDISVAHARDACLRRLRQARCGIRPTDARQIALDPRARNVESTDTAHPADTSVFASTDTTGPTTCADQKQ